MNLVLRTRALRLLDRARLLRPAYRAYETVRARRTGRGEAETEEDAGLALPPPRLRMLVAGTADPEWFVATGRVTAELVSGTAARHGLPLESVGRLLDFGCGCGRVTRHWAGLANAEVHGSDYNERLVRWCREHLRFASFAVNGVEPPLAYAAGHFDLVYAISVLTHLTEPQQHAWLAELRRVVRPGGLVLVTTHGDRYLERLAPAERERYEAGELVVRWGRVAGTNLCTAFHPERYVREEFARHFDVLEHDPEGAAAGSPHQDLVVLRRRAEPEAG